MAKIANGKLTYRHLVVAELEYPFEHFRCPECQRHIELLSVAELGDELGRGERWTVTRVKILLWEKPTREGQGSTIGALLPGSTALILAEDAEDYRVRSPLDGLQDT